MLHNNHLMGHVNSYYNLTIYITYHKHLVEDIIIRIEEIQYHK